MNKNRRKGVMYSLYFVRPKENADASRIAEQLMELKSVKEVLLTEGDCGFIVKARFTDGKEPTEVADYILKNVSSRYGRAISHYEYRK
jgi:DNA-binding Lrp family transcriptional regulator